MTKCAELLVLAAAVILAGTAVVGAVPVRSGEHATFSRLVFADTPGRDWSIERAGREAVIVFSEGAPELDLSQIFDLIPRRRIASAAAEAGRLVLGLGCDCRVEVSQIPTGHIVIDVRDGPVTPPADLPAAFGLAANRPFVLPLPEMRFGPFSSRNGHDSEVSGPARMISEGPSQIRRHPDGSVPLVITAGDETPRSATSSACQLEGIAQEVLTANPLEALSNLPAATAALLDGEDQLDAEGVSALARLYLAAGFGAEATQTSALGRTTAQDIEVVAAALDGTPYPLDVKIDPACGPATAVLALLDSSGTADWPRADESAFARFVDSMHPATASTLLPRLQDRLEELGLDDVLVAIDPTTPSLQLDLPEQEVVAAGTDERAVLAAIALLDMASNTGTSSEERHLINALALRPSLPQGPLRQSLDESLAKAFVLSRRPVEAVAMVADGAADAELLLGLAIDSLQPEVAAELAIRLRPHLPQDGAVTRRAAELFRSFGLHETANAFYPEGSPAPRPVDLVAPQTDPWLMRDMAGMVRMEREAWTARHRLAEEVVARNAATSPDTDLAAAEAVLEGSRRTMSLVAELVGAEGTR